MLNKNSLSGVRRTCTASTTRPAFPFDRPHLLKGNLEIKDEAGRHERRLTLILPHLESDRTLNIFFKSLFSPSDHKCISARLTEAVLLHCKFSEVGRLEVFKSLMADKASFIFYFLAEMSQTHARIIFDSLTSHRCQELIWPKPACHRCIMGISQVEKDRILPERSETVSDHYGYVRTQSYIKKTQPYRFGNVQ